MVLMEDTLDNSDMFCISSLLLMGLMVVQMVVRMVLMFVVCVLVYVVGLLHHLELLLLRRPDKRWLLSNESIGLELLRMWIQLRIVRWVCPLGVLISFHISFIL